MVGDNFFAVLVDAAVVFLLGQITEAFFKIGWRQHRRNV